MKLLKRLADNSIPSGFGTRMRTKRHAFFLKLLKAVPQPMKILDVGGTEQYWKAMGLPEALEYEVILLNIRKQETSAKNFRAIVGDATNMKEIEDQSFDIVFSNSVIEHVGNFERQKLMAEEVIRTGKRYFVQTPNYWFLIEPHFLLPGFQWLPRALRVWMIQHFNLGWYQKTAGLEQARDLVDHNRLLSRNEFQSLFPEAKLYEERVLGLTKSFIAYDGWD